MSRNFSIRVVVLFFMLEILITSYLANASTVPVENTAKTIVAMKHLLTTLFDRYKRDMKSLKSVVMNSNNAVNQLEANYKELSVQLQNLEAKVTEMLNNKHKNVDEGNIVQRASGKIANIGDSDDRIKKLEDLSRSYAARTCYELKLLGITKTGRYYIDPDGREMKSNQPIEGSSIQEICLRIILSTLYIYIYIF